MTPILPILLALALLAVGALWFLVNLVRLLRGKPSPRHLLLPPVLLLASIYGPNVFWFVFDLLHRGNPNAAAPDWFYDWMPPIYLALVPPAVGIATHLLTRAAPDGEPEAVPPPQT